MRTHARLTMPLAILILMGSAGVASAQSYSQATYYSQSSYETTPPQNFCERITTTLDDTYLARITQQKDKITQNRATADAKKTQRWAEGDALRAQKRSEADAKRQAQYARLMGIAGDDAAKIAAVNAFKSTIDAAIVVRRAAVDAAVARFRGDHDYFRNLRTTGIMTAFTTYETAMKSAIADAQTACSGGTASATVRTTFIAAVKSTHEAHKTERTGIQATFRSNNETLVATRKAAVEAAMNTFKASAESARAALKAALNS